MSNKLTRASRAAQFAPFDALKGLHEELAKREKRLFKRDKIEISEEKISEISSVLQNVKRKTRINIVFFHEGYYVEYDGEVRDVDYLTQRLYIGEGHVNFDDIYEISLQ